MGPLLAQMTARTIPEIDIDRYIRLTSDRQGQSGWLFSRMPITANNWMVCPPSLQWKYGGANVRFRWKSISRFMVRGIFTATEWQSGSQKNGHSLEKSLDIGIISTA